MNGDKRTLRDTLGKSRVVQYAVEELAEGSVKSNPNPRGVNTTSGRSTSLFSSGGGARVIEPPKDKYEEYWRLFETIPLVREPIRAYAAEVTAPGYWVKAPSEEGRKKLESWAADSAIVAGEKYQDLQSLLKKAVIQREVRGVALIEKARDGKSDNLGGFMLLPLQGMKSQTYPNQDILIEPEPSGDFDTSGYIKTEDGQIAAYIQDTGDKEITWSLDEVLKITRDEDVGEIFGTSRLEAVEPRIRSLRQKVADNDTAIKSMAWKFWLFKFGSEEDPWEEEEVQEFMENHTASEFEAGMKQGVTGDVDIDTISGEVADIQDALKFDIDWIVSAMPLPKYALGGFEENINQFVSRSQETRIEKQIQEARRELQHEFTPAFQEKAIEMGIVSEEEKDQVELVIGTPPEEQTPEDQEKTDTTRPPASSEKEAKENEATREESTNPEQSSSTGDEGSSGGETEEMGSEVEELAQSFKESDSVRTPDKGKGVVSGVMTENFEWPGPDGENRTVKASLKNPAYIVAVEAGGSDVYRGEDLMKTVLDPNDENKGKAEKRQEKMLKALKRAELSGVYEHVDDPHNVEVEELENVPGVDDPEIGFASDPKGWNRLTYLKAWRSVGASFTSCKANMTKHFGPKGASRWCSALKDEVLGTEQWRSL